KSSATGSVANTATVTAPAGVTDTAGNNSATDTETGRPSCRQRVSKNEYKGSVVDRNSPTYTIVVTNGGPSDVVGASVRDTMPTELTGASWTCVASGTGSCAAPSGASSISTTVRLPSREHATFMLTATVKSSATGSVANTATVTAPAGVTDTAGNNSATDT